jgi:hypothetical protein
MKSCCRRIFIESGAVSLAATAVLPGSVFAPKKQNGIIGVQLWVDNTGMR